MSGVHEVFYDSNLFQTTQGDPRHINLPPAMPMTSRPWIGMVVVVPTFAIGQQSEQPVVRAIFAGFVIPLSPNMGGGIDGPSDMPGPDRTHDNAPHEPLRTILQCSCPGTGC